MPTLNFKGKALVQNFHLVVPYHELKLVKSKGLNAKPSLHDNLVVHGDNLKALKSLLPYYQGKVKCIYVDPPYNTGNEKWIYNDNVSSPMIQEWLGKVVDREDLTRHDKWLCMMMPRLKILRELLNEDGLIGISIDENEFSSLITLCDEVFSEANRFGVVAVRNNPRGRRMGTDLAIEHEYLVLYARNRERFHAGRLPLTDEQLAEYSDEDLSGRKCRLLGLRKRGALSKRQDRPNLFYPLFVSPESGKVFVEDKRGLVRIFPKLSDGTDGVWRWSKSKVVAENHLLVAKEVRRRSGERELDVFEFDYPADELGEIVGRLFPSMWQGPEFNNELGREQLKELFDGKAVFENPKPVDLIKHFLFLAGAAADDDVVLDPFAGSGTTAQAVFELNNSDSKKRRFVLVEQEEFADRITAERVRRAIRALQNGAGVHEGFSFARLGDAMELETLLKADRLPSYADLASYVFYTATGEDFDASKINRKTGIIGKSAQYDVYLLYESDMEYLKNTALTLEVARNLPKGSGKKRLVFAPTKYLDSIHLEEYRIEFCQLPFEIYKAVKRKP